ncbi:MAG: Do family serine endopeptidase [Alphaproteobacteria bacterium]|nr:MAG: Do family serine endopeptidase [Alphaproteobacteria bacterium]
MKFFMEPIEFLYATRIRVCYINVMRSHHRTLLCLFIILCYSTLVSAYAQSTAVQVPQSSAQLQLSYAPVVQKSAPSVVNIYTSRYVAVRSGFAPLFGDPFFEQFFRGSHGAQPRKKEVHSLGSGVIIDPSGLVITSLHVVKDAEDIRIVLNNKKEYHADLVVQDASSDLALLQVRDAEGSLPALTMRDSDTLNVGDLVLAIGNPFGVGQTVTSGIISALARSAEGVADYDFFIQTDAAINPGNSGGALVDMHGRLIGINTAIYSKTGGYMGIGFAIPANMVRALIQHRGSDAPLVRPWLGAHYQDMTQEIATSLGLNDMRGVLIQDVFPDSPAAQAGLRSGDVIRRFDQVDIDSVSALKFRIGVSSKNTPIALQYYRKGKTYETKVTLISPPNPSQTAILLKGSHPLNGVRVAEITPTLAMQLGIQQDSDGVIVVELTNEANRGFLQEGDIILGCNNVRITSIKALQQSLQSSQQIFSLTLWRNGHTLALRMMQ